MLNDPVNIYLVKVNSRNTRKKYEKCPKLTIKTPERRHWGHSGVFIVNAEHISHLFLVFLLLTLNKKMLAAEDEEIYLVSIYLPPENTSKPKGFLFYFQKV